MDGRIAEFAKSIYPKFPAKGQSKLRQWAHETFEACYECEPDDAWEGFKEPRGKALDQFILMRTIPACVPSLPDRTLKCGYAPWSYDVDDLLGFVSFMDDVLMPAGYELSEEERDLMDHLHGIFAAEDEDEIFGEGDAEAARIFAEAFSRSPEFFEFQRGLEAARKALGDNTRVILTPDSPLLQSLQ